MNKIHRVCITCAPVLVFICAISISAQWNKKPYTEWSEKEATKVLNESPWGQTQVFSDTSKEFGTGVARGDVGTIDNRSGDYSTHHLDIRIRFLSSKPIRQAFSRLIALKQNAPINSQLAAQLTAFATQDFPDYIIICVDADAKETKNELREFRFLLDTAAMVDLKNDTYLSAKGERVFISSYQPPKKDGLGAKFIFPRNVNGKPAIAPDAEEIQFYSEFSNKYKLNMRFKAKDMMVDGKLEY
jgi:hypothetical protein